MNQHRLRAYLRMGITTLRYEGPHVLALRALRLACAPLGTLSIVTFCCKDLTDPVTPWEPRASVEIRRVEDDDAEQLAAVLLEANRTARRADVTLDAEKAEKIVRTRLEHGAVCFVARAGDEIVHYNWLFPGMRWRMTRYLEFVPTASTEVMLDDAFTAEAWRGKGIHGAVHARLLQFAQSGGFTASYTAVATDNRSSRKALKQLDYTCYSTGIIFEGRRSGKKRMFRLGRPLDRFRLP